MINTNQKHSHLTLEERVFIQQQIALRASESDIAKALGRSLSTIF